MNDFGEFLCDLRKEKRITQAELAEKLGVTNKAVSKWERGEAMPETSLLLPIAKIFDVSVDELLSGKRFEKHSQEAEKDKDSEHKEDYEKFDAKKHLFTRGKDDKESLNEMISGIVCSTLFLLSVAVYIILGLTKGLWHPGWVILPCSAFLCGMVGIISGLCDKSYISKKLDRGENPYTGAICGLIMLTCLMVYIPLGALLNLWHPCWAIVVGGGLICGIVGAFGNIRLYKNKNKDEK